MRRITGTKICERLTCTVAVSLADVNRLNTPVFAHCRYHSPTLIFGAGAGQFNLDGGAVLLPPDELITRNRQE